MLYGAEFPNSMDRRNFITDEAMSAISHRGQAIRWHIRRASIHQGGNLREKREIGIQSDASQSLRLLALSAQYPLPSRMAARTSCNAERLVAYRVLQ